MPSNDVLTRNEEGDLAVRTVSATESSTVVNPNDVYTRDEDGNLAIRTVGSGGDQHNLGYYATLTDLQTAYPTAEAGDWAIVGATDTVWIWDDTTSAWVDSDQKGQVTSVNNQTGDVTVQETLVSGTNIKTIDGNSVLGSGNLELSTYLTFPSGWTTNGTTKAFCDDVAADTSAVEGKAYLGEVTFSDLPASMANGEIIVEVMDGTTAQNKVIVLTLTSGNTAPYMWKYTYWNGGSDVSGWKGFQEQLVSGTNIKTINNQSVLGSGNISIASGGGIDWTGHWDMPTSASGYAYLRLDCNMLPEGHYRFYQQSFNFAGYSNNLQPDTYMIDFYVDSSNGIAGVVNRVMDGQSTFADYNSFEYYSRDVMKAAIFDGNSKLGIWSEYNLMMSNIGIQSRSEVVNNVFRWTDIKNVDTNDTYTLTAYVVYDVIPEPSNIDSLVGLTSLPSINQPEQPTNYTTFVGVVQSSVFGVRLDSFGTIFYRGSNYYDGSSASSSVSIYITDYKDSVFDAELFVEKTYCIINKATGIFANTEFVVDTDSLIYIKYNFSNQDVGTYFYISAGKLGGDCTQIYLNEVDISEMQTTYPVPCVCVGRTVTPNVLGQIQQYTGTTNANYTNGYFYKASGTLTLTPSTATISVSLPSGASVSIDFDALIPLLRKYYYYDYGYIIEQFTNGSSCTYSGDGSSVAIFYNTFTQPDILACFTVTGNNGNNVEFNISNLVLNGYSVSNGHWEQVNVQPASSGSGLQNTATGSDSLTLLGTASTVANSVNIGTSSVILGAGGVAVGKSAKANTNGIAMGEGCESANFGIAIGRGQKVTANYAIQIGGNTFGTNNIANTVRISNENGNFEIMSANGTIPEARLADMTNAAQGMVLTLDANNNAVWATPSGGGGGGSTSATATLVVNDWSNNTQTVNVTGVTASNNVIVAPAPSSQANYSSAGVLCEAQGNGTLTFTCTSTPTSALTVNVLII